MVPDADALAQFASNRACYEYVVQVMRSESTVTRVELTNDGKLTVSPTRPSTLDIEGLRTVMIQGNISAFAGPERQGSDVYVGIPISSSGLSVSGSFKSFIHTEGSVSECVSTSDTDQYMRGVSSSGFSCAYRRIGRNWYLLHTQN
jgi:hypothetical protein